MNNKNDSTKKRSVLSILSTVITVLIFALVVFILVNVIVCKIQNKPTSIFGFSFSVVQTNSMEDEIMTGDLIVFKGVDASTLKVGDNIVFRADDNFKDGSGKSLAGYTIVHKIVDITDQGFVTRGVNNVANDDGIRSASDVYGLCVANSAGWGKVFTFFGKYGVIILVAVIAVPVIVTQTIKIVKLSKSKKENSEDEKTDG